MAKAHGRTKPYSKYKRASTRQGKIKSTTQKIAKSSGNCRADVLPSLTLQADVRKRLFLTTLIILLIFGSYKAIILFGANPVPNPDYSGFVSVSQRILHFQMPDTFKRPPVTGILPVLLSNFVGGHHPILTASWLANALLSIITVVFLWLLARQLIGSSAVFFAIIATLNPWLLRLQTVPIAETTMVAFMVITFYFICKHSRWAYLFAMLASMTRYECVALIPIAFIMDIIHQRQKVTNINNQQVKSQQTSPSPNNKKTQQTQPARQAQQAQLLPSQHKLQHHPVLVSVLYAFLASLPFILWMIGTALTWNTGSRSHHYLRDYHPETAVVGTTFIKYIWQTTFAPLLQTPLLAQNMPLTARRPYTYQQVQAITSSLKMLNSFSQIIAAFCVAIAFIYAIVCAFRRNWKLLCMFIFLALYVTAHSLKAHSQPRYAAPVTWLVLLVAFAGVYGLYQLIKNKFPLPPPIKITLQLIFIVVVIVWCLLLIFKGDLSRISRYCTKSATLPWAAIITVIAVLISHLVFYKRRFLLYHIAIAVLSCLFVVSLYFSAAPRIGNGSYNIEFKKLADWYTSHAQPGEKMACTWAALLRLMADKDKDNIIDLKTLKAPTLAGLIKNCRKKNVVYIIWTPRGGKSTRAGLHQFNKLLSVTHDVPPLKFIKRIQIGSGTGSTKWRWVNIFKLPPANDK